VFVVCCCFFSRIYVTGVLDRCIKNAFVVTGGFASSVHSFRSIEADVHGAGKQADPFQILCPSLAFTQHFQRIRINIITTPIITN
jgi:hypothetical protein